MALSCVCAISEEDFDDNICHLQMYLMRVEFANSKHRLQNVNALSYVKKQRPSHHFGSRLECKVVLVKYATDVGREFNRNMSFPCIHMDSQ